MKTLILLILSPNNGAINFQNRFRDDLYKEGIFLAFLYGIIYSFNSESVVPDDKTLLIYFKLFEKIIQVCLWLLISTTLSFVIYKLGLFLKGNSYYKETFALLMYSYFPIFCYVFILNLLNHPHLYNSEFSTYYFKTLLFIISWFISLRTLLIGFKEIYNISLKKAIIVILPILIPFFSLIVFQLYLRNFYL
ncbi:MULTISPECIES: YIP1 family protein [Tenacibaculum]|uniref:Yip1 domain-containing protein n=1 Tax=Tenacibaculum aiptasiae TaxID=426481 RepID=A0A7J5AQ70_9FLAO|nr:hypothetical protein F7018_04385 [Tenacibaculum aiptasiae]